MSVPIDSDSSLQICNRHPDIPKPQDGAICNCTVGNNQSIDKEPSGVFDLTASASSQIHKGSTKFMAPVANMYPVASTSNTIISTSLFYSKDRSAPFIITPGHDWYSDRFALSPKDRPQLYAGNHNSDEFALSPDDTADEAEKVDNSHPKVPKIQDTTDLKKNTGKVKDLVQPEEEDNLDDGQTCTICLFLDSVKRYEILSCGSCGLAVHRVCYGIRVIPKGDWVCKRCRRVKNEDKTRRGTKHKRRPQEEDEDYEEEEELQKHVETRSTHQRRRGRMEAAE